MSALPPITASAIISFSTELEARSEAFYQALAARFPEQGTAFRSMAQECAKSSTQVRRTYQETITDALEAGYSFAGLALGDYRVDTALPAGIDLPAALARALVLEERAAAFYQDVAERSESLLATIPRAFRRAARTRRRRQSILESF